MGILVSAVGCTSGTPFPMATVKGTVTYQGKPLDHGRVVFLPEQGTPGPAAVGVIQSDGSFRVENAGREGAALGWHRVTVHCRGELTGEENRNRAASEFAVPKSLIPEKYSSAEQSPLRFEVKEGRNEWSIVLD